MEFDIFGSFLLPCCIKNNLIDTKMHKMNEKTGVRKV